MTKDGNFFKGEGKNIINLDDDEKQLVLEYSKLAAKELRDSDESGTGRMEEIRKTLELSHEELIHLTAKIMGL